MPLSSGGAHSDTRRCQPHGEFERSDSVELLGRRGPGGRQAGQTPSQCGPRVERQSQEAFDWHIIPAATPHQPVRDDERARANDSGQALVARGGSTERRPGGPRHATARNRRAGSAGCEGHLRHLRSDPIGDRSQPSGRSERFLAAAPRRRSVDPPRATRGQTFAGSKDPASVKDPASDEDLVSERVIFCARLSPTGRSACARRSALVRWRRN